MVEIWNTGDLVRPDSYKWKVLVVGRSRVGKTSWAGTAENPGFAALETGWGQGLLSLHHLKVDAFTPKTLHDLDALASGHIFKDKSTIVVDSLSAMARTIIKDYAIAIPRRGLNSPKREAGVPELDDYGVMGEITRRILAAINNLDKNVIVTALEKNEKDENGGAISCGPDLPGQMYLAAPAMFDTVLYLKTRKAFRNPKDGSTAYTEHFFLTQNDGFHIGGDRNTLGNGKAIFAREEIFDLESGRGTWLDLRGKLQRAYATEKIPSN